MQTIGKKEEAVLQLLTIFPYMLGIQVTHYLYSESSHRSVLQIMTWLQEHQLTERKPLPSQIRAGSVPYIYWLSSQGRHYLETLGYDFSDWLPVNEMKLPGSSHLWHALDVNDFLIAGCNLANTHPDIKLMDIRHDLVIQRTMQLPVRPDGWMLFHIKGVEEVAIWPEIDRGSEKEKAWRSKVEALLTYIHTRYEKDFNTPVVTVAVVIPANIMGADYRLRQLKHWTEQQLIVMNQQHEYDLFRFIVLPEKYTPQWLYLDKVWEKPFTTGKHSLIDI